MLIGGETKERKEVAKQGEREGGGGGNGEFKKRSAEGKFRSTARGTDNAARTGGRTNPANVSPIQEGKGA